MRFLKKSFRNRLFAAMLLCSLIPLLICTVLMTRITRLRLDSKTREDGAEQTAALLGSMDLISDAITSSATRLQDTETAIHSLGAGTGSRLQINSLLFDATDSYRNLAVFDLYDSTGICRYSTRGTVSASLSTDWGVLYGAAQKPGQPVYYATEDPSDAGSPLLIGAVQLRAEDGCKGFLVMRLYLAGFHSLLDGKYSQSDILILSPFFRPIFSSQSYLTQTLAPELRQQLLAGEIPEDGEYVYSISRHETTGLYLVLRQPRMFTAETVRLLYTASLICMLVCILISVLVSFPISRQITSPLRRLMAAFDKLQQADLETQLPVKGTDEFARLAVQFNRMVLALKSNREELISNQQELNEAQIRMLQAQLNPHFLCNTLDTMKWISKINKVPQVALMSTNLADILRFCISAEEFVPLYQELEILERYIEIQKLRLSDDFAFRQEIPEELYDCLVPKMILQPIVENAILHGLSGVAGSVIRVRAEEKGETLYITVTDNGQGFPPEMTGRPYLRDKDLAKGHLGLYNVDMILRRNFGEEYGLFLERGDEGVGASVTASLPIRYEEDT
ncbi:MAG: sensor histidine kinase [Candidatus Faecousia sp.]|nr:sensor histidine kinase [Candidatus Faecousia sp.]